MTTFSNYLQSVYFNLARRKKTIFQLVIVFGVIFASLAVAIINPSQTILLLVAATILGLFGIYFILQWPSLGLILTIIGGFFIKFSGPSNINIAVLGVL